MRRSYYYGAGVVLCLLASSHVPAGIILASPSSLPIGVPSGSPTVDNTALLKDFQKSQTLSLANLVRAQRKAVADMKASQNVRRKEWKDRERETRHKFLATQPKGPETRTYMRDYVDRMKALDHGMEDERRQLDRENKARYDAERVDQGQRMKEFKEAMDHGQTPPSKLWPDH